MILVLGSGVAGLSCALAAAAAGVEVELATLGALTTASGGGIGGAAALAGGSTAMAQGGIAAAVGTGDDPAAHAADTVAAGAGLVDPEAAGVLASVGATVVRALISDGFPADRTADGALVLGLEAAHGRPRIVHAGEDRSGAVLHAFLVAQVLAEAASGRIRLAERRTAVSLLGSAGAVTGAVLRDSAGRLTAVSADAVVLATGGYAALYPRTSNHAGSRGEGVVLAARAGALVADLEFVQFHPTVLVGDAGDGPSFLVSEAVRGAGAVLRDGAGRRFMADAHPAAELAPRDVVSRTVHRVLRERGEEAVWLDATSIERAGGAGALARRFPRITAAALGLGYDWSREPIPVAPAAHYTMGGIATDLDGRTSVPGLFAAGEVAATGVHGANRLASNSLLEGLVFGRRAALAAAEYASTRSVWAPHGAALAALAETVAELPGRLDADAPVKSGSNFEADAGSASGSGQGGAIAADVRTALAAGLGIERDGVGLAGAARLFASTAGPLAELSGMIAAAAAARTESRGAHQRADHPETDPAQSRRRAWAVRSAALTPAVSSTTRSLAAC